MTGNIPFFMLLKTNIEQKLQLTFRMKKYIIYLYIVVGEIKCLKK